MRIPGSSRVVREWRKLSRQARRSPRGASKAMLLRLEPLHGSESQSRVRASLLLFLDAGESLAAKGEVERMPHESSATTVIDEREPSVSHLEVLRALEQKILWLAVWTIHHANHIRPKTDGLKVGGHQASSASLVTLMTALYFDALRPADRVAVKPHASPVFHAIQYLLGRQTRRQARTLPGIRRRPVLPVAHQRLGRRRFFDRFGRSGRRHDQFRRARPGVPPRQASGGRRPPRRAA